MVAWYLPAPTFYQQKCVTRRHTLSREGETFCIEGECASHCYNKIQYINKHIANNKE